MRKSNGGGGSAEKKDKMKILQSGVQGIPGNCWSDLIPNSLLLKSVGESAIQGPSLIWSGKDSDVNHKDMQGL